MPLRALRHTDVHPCTAATCSQKDCEEADIDKERLQQEMGPEARQHELDELTQIYVNRGLTLALAKQVAGSSGWVS